jgi:hypothetical protein
MNRRSNILVAAVAIAATLAIVGPGVDLGVWPPYWVESCTLGSTVTTESLWTPVVVANSPFGGVVSVVAASYGSLRGVDTSQLSISLTNGSSGGIFSLDTWEIVRQSNTSGFGFGVNKSCGSPYSAYDLNRSSIVFAGRVIVTSTLLESNSTNDIGVPHSTLISDFDQAPSVEFTANYTTSISAASFDECSASSGQLPETIHITGMSLTFEVPWRIGSFGGVQQVTLPADYELDYEFPSMAGLLGDWSVEDISSTPGGIGSGLAFDWSPCS